MIDRQETKFLVNGKTGNSTLNPILGNFLPQIARMGTD
jgi:hypothetical protein